MNAFNLSLVLLWQKDNNAYAKHDVEISKWLNELTIASLMNELNIWVNDKFDLLPILGKGGIMRLKIILDDIFFMSEAVIQALNTWIFKKSQEGPSKTVGVNIALLILQFLACSIYLSDVHKLTFETATYLLEGLTKFTAEEFSKPFYIMLQQ